MMLPSPTPVPAPGQGIYGIDAPFQEKKGCHTSTQCIITFPKKQLGITSEDHKLHGPIFVCIGLHVYYNV